LTTAADRLIELLTEPVVGLLAVRVEDLNARQAFRQVKVAA
jgi:hypothetical protein